MNISSTLADNNTSNGTQTLAIFDGSFAINAGTDNGAPSTDQRGYGRNGTTDIGAYELSGIGHLTWTGVISNDWNNPGNWLENIVPSELCYVTIPSSPSSDNFPVIPSGTIVHCNTLTLKSGVIITVNGTLEVEN